LVEEAMKLIELTLRRILAMWLPGISRRRVTRTPAICHGGEEAIGPQA
jgi:hypothetical protein